MTSLLGGIGKHVFAFQLRLADNAHSQVFPSYSSARRPICKNSALSRIKARRLELRNANVTPVQ